MRYFSWFSIFVIILSGCYSSIESNWDGYIEGDFVFIAPTTGGTLKTLSVKRGDTVTKGQPLFALDLAELQAQLESAQAEVELFQAEVKNAQKEYERVRILVKSDAATKARLDDVTTELRTFQSSLSSAHQNVVQLKTRIDDAAPTAPVDGIIQETFYEEDEFVAQGRPVISLLAPENIKVRFFVSQQDVVTLSLQQSIDVFCDGCEHSTPARITYISPNVEFTPPVIYSVQSRDKLVFLVEASLEKNNPIFKCVFGWLHS